MKKFEELFKLSKEIFAAEHQRFSRLEAKGFSYLTALTFFIGFGIPLGIKAFAGLTPPTTFSAWMMLNLIVVAMIGLVVNWFIAFSVVKVSSTPSLPLNEEVIRFFKENREIDVYYTMAKGYSAAWKELVEINNRKARWVTISHMALRVNVVIITGVFLLAFARGWSETRQVSASSTLETNSVSVYSNVVKNP